MSLVYGGKTARSIVQRTRQHNADGSRTYLLCQRVEEGVYGAITKLVSRADQEVGPVAVYQSKMAIRLTNVAVALFQDRRVTSDDYRHFAAGCQYIPEVTDPIAWPMPDDHDYSPRAPGQVTEQPLDILETLTAGGANRDEMQPIC
jgi:hypothetical protein